MTNNGKKSKKNTKMGTRNIYMAFRGLWLESKLLQSVKQAARRDSWLWCVCAFFLSALLDYLLSESLCKIFLYFLFLLINVVPELISRKFSGSALSENRDKYNYY